MWLLHFKHSHWWKRRSWSKFGSHYVWGTNGVCECKMGCKVYMDSYMPSKTSCFMVIGLISLTTSWRIPNFLHGIEYIMFHGHLDQSHRPPLGGRPNTKTERPRHSKRLQPLIYSILVCVRICMNRNFILIAFSIELGHICLHTCTWGSVTTPTWLLRCLGTAFEHFLLGSHNFMVTVLGSCVKWP